VGLCARVRSSAGGARLIVRYARVCARRAERGTRVGWIDNLSAGWQTTPGECLRYVFVSNELGGTVAMLRGNVIVKIVTDAVQPAGLAATGSVMGMLDARENALTVHDTDRLRIIGSAPAGAGPTQLVADRRGRMIAADTHGNAIPYSAHCPHPDNWPLSAKPANRKVSRTTPNTIGSGWRPRAQIKWSAMT